MNSAATSIWKTCVCGIKKYVDSQIVGAAANNVLCCKYCKSAFRFELCIINDRSCVCVATNSTTKQHIPAQMCVHNDWTLTNAVYIAVVVHNSSGMQNNANVQSRFNWNTYTWCTFNHACPINCSVDASLHYNAANMFLYATMFQLFTRRTNKQGSAIKTTTTKPTN